MEIRRALRGRRSAVLSRSIAFVESPAVAAPLLAGLALFLLSAALVPNRASAAVIRIAPDPQGSAGSELREALARAAATAGAEAVTIELAPGDYRLQPVAAVDSSCGNCEDPNESVAVTVGLRVRGRGIRIRGDGPALVPSGPDGREATDAAVLHTNAGYGILFEDCEGCALENVIVTGGIRDTSGKATDAAVVVKRSTVSIDGCVLRDNIGDPAVVRSTVVGVIGIAGREGSRIRITGNRILRNSWDGIALYRDAEAEIRGNVIDGVDLARGEEVGGGRGVGIGVTWNARARIEGNLVTRYWKGIGLFVDAEGTVEENVVETIATWGLSLWDADKGRPRGVFRWNVVDSTGACGAMVLRSASDPPAAGSLVGNAFVRTGQDPRYDTGEPYCLQTAIALHAAPEGFPVEENLFYANREPGGTAGAGDVERAAFIRRSRPLLTRLAQWPNLRESRFFREFGVDAR